VIPHAGNRKTSAGWFLGQQALDVFSRHMTLDDVTAHRTGMAGGHLLRHAEAFADGVHVPLTVSADVEAVRAQVLNPFGAALAIRTPPNFDRGLGWVFLWTACRQHHDDQTRGP